MQNSSSLDAVMNRPAADEIKDAQKKHWNAVAEGWAKWHAWTAENFSPLSVWLSHAANWTPGAVILDVACGAGFPAFEAAARVRPGGRVIGTDLAPRMVEVTGRLAREAGLANLEVVEMEAESLQFPDDTFDAVTCVCGLMFCAEPARAVAEMRRVLKPGGRLAIAVWNEPSANPFATVIRGAVAGFLGFVPPPPRSAPGPFRFAASGELETLMRNAGLNEVEVEDLQMPFEFQSANEYLDIVSDIAGWRQRLDALSTARFTELRNVLHAAVRPYTVEGRVRVDAAALCASARKAAEVLSD